MSTPVICKKNKLNDITVKLFVTIGMCRVCLCVTQGQTGTAALNVVPRAVTTHASHLRTPARCQRCLA